MKRIIYILMAVVALAASPLRAEQWRLHPTYGGFLNRIIDTPDYTYVVSHNQPYIFWLPDNAQKTDALFRYDKDADETTYLNISNKLSGPTIVAAEYNYDRRYLMVTYDDGNIDLLYDNGDVMNIPGFMAADDTYSKDVNSITFSQDGSEAYLATDFGYLTINDKKGEMGYSRVLNREVLAAAPFDGKVFIGTADGLYFQDPSDPDRSRLTEVPDAGEARKFFMVNGQLFFLGGDGWDTVVKFINPSADGTYTPSEYVRNYINEVERVGKTLQVSAYAANWILDGEGKTRTYPKPEADYEKKTISYDLRNFWIDNGREGVSRKTASPDNAQWQPASEIILPNAAQSFKSTGMAYSPKYGILVRNHGYDWNFGNIEPGTNDLISGLKNMEWTPYSITARLPQKKALELMNPNGLAIDPRNADHVYCGSPHYGLLRLDLSDPTKSLRISRKGDAYADDSSVIAVMPDQSGDNYKFCSFGNPEFDANGNLWAPFFNIDNGNSGAELWCWTADNRAATTTAANYRPMKKIVLSDVGAGNGQRLLPLKASANKNLLLYSSANSERSFVLLDHKGTLDSSTDDTRLNFPKTLYDQDGSALTHAYILALYEDPSTGNVWVGTDKGVFYFSPQTAMKNGSDARVTRVKVARNDGTQFADYLLADVKINDITSDGSGRKWFATHGGGLVCTTSSGAQVIKTYTSANSLLPSNIVYGICYNPENNSMMISTDSGLAELYISGTAAEDSDDSKVVVYPNPVRPDFYGYVTIEGLEDGAIVKITDSAGNMIKEIGYAEGGTVQWDATNLNNKRVRSGVYYVLASGGPDSSGFAAVGKILVVN